MTQQTELPENSEARVLVAHLCLNLYTDDNIGVDAEANRQQLVLKVKSA